MIAISGQKQLQIHGVRAVNRIVLPIDWVVRPSQTTNRELVERIGPAGDLDTNLLFYSRPIDLPIRERQSFADLLQGDPRILNKMNVSENYSVLRYRSDASDFQLDDARTVDWNSRRTLVTSGNWIKSGRKIFSLITDATESKTQFQEISFSAMAERFRQNEAVAMKAMYSICWNQMSRPDDMCGP